MVAVKVSLKRLRLLYENKGQLVPYVVGTSVVKVEAQAKTTPEGSKERHFDHLRAPPLSS